jgi:hypothetical protein
MHLVRIHFTASVLFLGLTAAFPAAAAEEVEDLEASPLAYRDEVLVASGIEMESLIERDFVAFDPAYEERRTLAGERLHALAGRLATIQATGNSMACSNQIFLETKWLYHYTADWARLEAGLDRLEESLGNLDQAFVTRSGFTRPRPPSSAPTTSWNGAKSRSTRSACSTGSTRRSSSGSISRAS